MAYMGEVKLVAYDFVPRDYMRCDGRLLKIDGHTALFALLGTRYGGDGRTTFGLPNLQVRVPISSKSKTLVGTTGGRYEVTLDAANIPPHSHGINVASESAEETTPDDTIFAAAAPRAQSVYAPPGAGAHGKLRQESIGNSGRSEPHSNMQPTIALNYVISAYGFFPPKGGPQGGADDGDEDYIGDIRAFPYAVVPREWAPCDGKILQIQSNQSLYSLIGTTFGGDGKTTFALPDMRGFLACGAGTLDTHTHKHGQRFGSETVAIDPDQMPPHSHDLVTVDAAASEAAGAGNLLSSQAPIYTQAKYKDLMHQDVIEENLGGADHSNIMPYTTANYCIKVDGLFPSHS